MYSFEFISHFYGYKVCFLIQSSLRGKTHLFHSLILNSFFPVSVYKMYLNSIYYGYYSTSLFPNCLFPPLPNREYSIYEFNPTIFFLTFPEKKFTCVEKVTKLQNFAQVGLQNVDYLQK